MFHIRSEADSLFLLEQEGGVTVKLEGADSKEEGGRKQGKQTVKAPISHTEHAPARCPISTSSPETQTRNGTPVRVFCSWHAAGKIQGYLAHKKRQPPSTLQ